MYKPQINGVMFLPDLIYLSNDSGPAQSGGAL